MSSGTIRTNIAKLVQNKKMKSQIMPLGLLSGVYLSLYIYVVPVQLHVVLMYYPPSPTSGKYLFYILVLLLRLIVNKRHHCFTLEFFILPINLFLKSFYQAVFRPFYIHRKKKKNSCQSIYLLRQVHLSNRVY